MIATYAKFLALNRTTNLKFLFCVMTTFNSQLICERYTLQWISEYPPFLSVSGSIARKFFVTNPNTEVISSLLTMNSKWYFGQGKESVTH